MRVVRVAVESVLLMLLAGIMLVVAIVATRHVFADDEKAQYVTIGYYGAIHHDLVRWVWRKLRVDRIDAGKTA